ncbi:phosphate signaling complex protein PhoU [Ureibacillus composti]|nr:phosphate signaling complex protein PhoU [Ureibacillus composti]
MSVRKRFDLELEALQKEFLVLAEKSINTLEKSFTVFTNKDTNTAEQIIEEDVNINQLEESINDQVILLLTKQQPIVGTDLRRLIILLKAAADMERVGDYAVKIAKTTIRIGKDRFVTSIELMEDMCYKTSLMLRHIVQAFIDENTTKAKEIAELDDTIDEMYRNIIKHLMSLSNVKPEYVPQITYLSFVCRSIERCADHATNIAEYLFYLKKGLRLDLNN